MISSLRAAWRRLRQRFWAALTFDVCVMLLLLFGIHSWQTRDLPIDLPAPPLQLAFLTPPSQLAPVKGKGLVYFFAPWCGYCRHSIGNLDDVLESGQVDWVRAVALDFESVDEVTEFVAETRLRAPVQLGTAKTASEWSIRAFPTYYVVDRHGLISSRSVGYSTRLGMQWRAWRAD